MVMTAGIQRWGCNGTGMIWANIAGQVALFTLISWKTMSIPALVFFMGCSVALVVTQQLCANATDEVVFVGSVGCVIAGLASLWHKNRADMAQTTAFWRSQLQCAWAAFFGGAPACRMDDTPQVDASLGFCAAPISDSEDLEIQQAATADDQLAVADEAVRALRRRAGSVPSGDGP